MEENGVELPATKKHIFWWRTQSVGIKQIITHCGKFYEEHGDFIEKLSLTG
jgi:hypothetical protein